MLTVVQRVLSDLNYDQVQSIYDTNDALAVARIVSNIHSSILTEYPWIIKDAIIQPLRIDLTTVSIPSSAQRVRTVKYTPSKKCDKRKPTLTPDRRKEDHWGGNTDGNDCCYPVRSTSCHQTPYEYFDANPFGGCEEEDNGCTELTYLDLQDFIKICKGVEECPSECPKPDDIVCYTDSCGKTKIALPDMDVIPDMITKDSITINNNKDPEFWTVIGSSIVLDSYCFRDGQGTVERRLQLVGQTVDELEVTDNAVINLPTEFYNYFIAESLSTASYTLNNTANEKEESRSQRLRRRLLREHGIQGKKRHSIEYPTKGFWRK